jgi:molybdopterin converting factor small subunit
MSPMAPLTVSVRLSGPLAAALGPQRSVAMQDGATVTDLLEQLACEAELEKQDAGSLAATAGGAFLSRTHALADGDELSVLVPVSGG